MARTLKFMQIACAVLLISFCVGGLVAALTQWAFVGAIAFMFVGTMFVAGAIQGLGHILSWFEKRKKPCP